ncbi:MAG: hypothetical protein CMH75_04965 [Nitrospina sp.]|nr:hypothetical protein [Nitrospina sp.]
MNKIFIKYFFTSFVFLVSLYSGFLNSLEASSRFKHQPQRIISTSPSITEILFELGLKERIVAVTDFCSYPEEACLLPSIGGVLNPDIETIISLTPDLIIQQTDSEKMKNNFKSLGIPTLSINVRTISDIFESINRLGKELNCQKTAKNLLSFLKNKINNYKLGLMGRPKKKVLLLLGDSSNPGRDLYAVGPGTFLNELLVLSGGKNILTNSKAQYPKLSKEYIIEQSPEIIIEAGPKSNLSQKKIDYRVEQWNRFPTIQAVKNKRIHFIGADYILIPGPRLVKILESFAKVIHTDLSVPLIKQTPPPGTAKP